MVSAMYVGTFLVFRVLDLVVKMFEKSGEFLICTGRFSKML